MAYTFDLTKPADASLISAEGAGLIRTDKTTLRDALQEEHNFPTACKHTMNAARVYMAATIISAPITCLEGKTVLLEDTFELLVAAYDAYNGKTATFTTGSPTITGAATTFLSTVKPGAYAVVDADGSTKYVKVLSVDTDLQLTLESNYLGAGGAGKVFTILNPLTILPKDQVFNTDLFGSGTDGDYTTVGNVAVTNNRQYDDLTISAGHTFTYGHSSYLTILRVRGTLTVNGTLKSLQNSSGGGWGGSGGGGGASAGGAGGNIGIGHITALQPFIAASTQSNITLGSGGVAGAGAGGVGGIGAASPLNSYKHLLPFFLLPAGSAGGNGDAGAAGGKGSNGLIIFARNIVVGAAGIIHADGDVGTGGAGAGDGGGGGGGGGILSLTYRLLTNGGAIRANGGTGGAGNAGGGNGGVGGAGLVISNRI